MLSKVQVKLRTMNETPTRARNISRFRYGERQQSRMVTQESTFSDPYFKAPSATQTTVV